MRVKMIIIDDEAVIRESLRRFIDWESIDVEICDIASNGMTALASILNLQPDIILTDICMPGLDGLELIRLLREQEISSEVIFISAHTNFEYARQALSLGAFDYVIKPIDEEALISTVKLCKEKIESASRTKSIIFDYQQSQTRRQQLLFSRLFSSDAHLTEEETAILETAPGWNAAYTYTAAIGLWYLNTEEAFLSQEILEELFSSDSRYPFLLLTPFANTQFVFFFTEQQTSSALSQYVRQTASADFFLRKGMITTVSDPYVWEKNFSNAYTDCTMTYVFQSFQNDTGIYFFHDTFVHAAPVRSPEEFCETYFSQLPTQEQIIPILKDFLVYYIANKSIYDLEFMKLQTIRLVDSWVENLRRYHLHDYLEQDILSAQKSIAARHYLHEVYETAYHLFLNITVSLEQLTQNTSKQLIRNSLTYIHEHFAENLTLVDLAAHLYVSSAYLSKVFSAEIGQPFSKYLQEYRVHRAIEYLQNPQYKIYHIAKICGFSDVAYFSKIFKTVTGMTPNQYRNAKL